ncbi:hypothetical protein KAT80_00860 [Candidatus Pacearchaeota archaeon]|nr:hypothetical protein [Candidatus Pacearchaeota archaeon]
MKIFIFILMFFIIGALLIISNNNLAMCQQSNVAKFSELYVEWFDGLYANSQILIKEIVKLNWFPE